MNLAGLCGLNNYGYRGILARLYEIRLKSRHSEQRRNRHMILVNTAVRKNQNCRALIVRLIRLAVEFSYSSRERLVFAIQHGYIGCFETVQVTVAYLKQVQIGKHRFTTLSTRQFSSHSSRILPDTPR